MDKKDKKPTGMSAEARGALTQIATVAAVMLGALALSELQGPMEHKPFVQKIDDKSEARQKLLTALKKIQEATREAYRYDSNYRSCANVLYATLEPSTDNPNPPLPDLFELYFQNNPLYQPPHYIDNGWSEAEQHMKIVGEVDSYLTTRSEPPTHDKRTDIILAGAMEELEKTVKGLLIGREEGLLTTKQPDGTLVGFISPELLVTALVRLSQTSSGHEHLIKDRELFKGSSGQPPLVTQEIVDALVTRYQKKFENTDEKLRSGAEAALAAILELKNQVDTERKLFYRP